MGHTKYKPIKQKRSYYSWQYVDSFSDALVPRGDDECWPWSASYLFSKQMTEGSRFFLRLKYNGKHYMPQQIAWEIYTGLKLSRAFVIVPLCGSQLCCNPRHLTIMTKKKAMDEKHVLLKKSDRGRGTINRLIAADIIKMIETTTWTSARIGEKFGVSRFIVHKIRKAETWKDLERNYEIPS